MVLVSRRSVVLYVLFWANGVEVYAQPPRDTDRVWSALSFFAPLVVPKVVADGALLKQYVRSQEFAGLRRRKGDLAAVDAIFAKARVLSWDNIYEALLISLAATMDHRRVGVRVPIFGPLLWFPLTSEFEAEFQARIAALPGRIYHDSPTQGSADRDKLQHFFGSAFVYYVWESEAVAERVGDFVEWGEDRFIVDGVLDERDTRANRQGRNFGRALLEGGIVRPSVFLQEATPGLPRPGH